MEGGVLCEGTDTVNLIEHGVQLKVKAIAMTNIVQGIDMVMGMDMLRKLVGCLRQ